MKGPPPYWVRRLIWLPAFVVGSILLFLALPLWALVALFASRFVPGRWRPLRIAWFLCVYLFFECLGLLGAFVLWVGTGFGWKIQSTRSHDLHYSLAAWWLRRVVGSARRTFHLTFDDESDIELDPGRPLIILSRHAGPGDSVLLVDGVLNEMDRRPRIVLKDLIQLDPFIDVVLNRLPNRFVPSSGRAGAAVVEALYSLSETMSAVDALVLFPEGGNYTSARHERAVEKLEEIGRPGLAAQARDMRHVLPPKPTGALAAIAAAPTADIVFVGHVGLERLSTLADLWRGIPMDAGVTTRLWLVPAGGVPAEPAREQWLYDRWRELDDWIDATLAVRQA